MPIKTPPSVGCITTTTGTGAYAIGSALTQGSTTLFTFTEAVSHGWLADGEQVYYACRNASGGLEEGIGTYNHAAQTLARTTIKKSTNGGGAQNWGAGNKDLFVTLISDEHMTGSNNLSEVTNDDTAQGNIGATTTGKALFTAASAAAARTTLMLGTAATLNVGTGASQIVQRTGTGAYPSGDGSAITGIAGVIPAGTVMLFYQAAAPTGWTRVTTVNDMVPMVVSAGSPGTTNAATWDIIGLSADDHTLTTSEIPSHTHNIAYFAAQLGTSGSAVIETLGVGTSSATSESTGGGDPHGHTVSSTGTWRPPGAYMLLASRNA